MRKYAQRLAYWSLKQSLRLCRASGLCNPKGLAMDAAGDIKWHGNADLSFLRIAN